MLLEAARLRKGWGWLGPGAGKEPLPAGSGAAAACRGLPPQRGCQLYRARFWNAVSTDVKNYVLCS